MPRYATPPCWTATTGYTGPETQPGPPAALPSNDAEFERRLQTPRTFARDVGTGFGEYLCRALSHRAALTEPKDLAWLLASYARDGLARVEAAGDAPSLQAVRSALEEALGVRFEGEKWARFFHSTLVQTLFYGVFSAWVLWARADAESGDEPPSAGGYGGAKFDWRTAVWHLRAPVLRALFQQLSDPGRLQPLGLVEVLDWTSAALDRVDQGTFIARFDEGEAVPYFSYRDSSILGRSLLPEEVQHFTDTARRIGAILAATKSSHPDRNTSYGS